MDHIKLYTLTPLKPLSGFDRAFAAVKILCRPRQSLFLADHLIFISESLPMSWVVYMFFKDVGKYITNTKSHVPTLFYRATDDLFLCVGISQGKIYVHHAIPTHKNHKTLKERVLAAFQHILEHETLNPLSVIEHPLPLVRQTPQKSYLWAWGSIFLICGIIAKIILKKGL